MQVENMYLTTIGNWTFEVVQIRARKTIKHKTPYTGILNITIVDGTPHIEGLLSRSKFNKSDFLSIKRYINKLGFNSVEYIKFPPILNN